MRLSDRDILDHAGKVSHDTAVLKAHDEYARFSEKRAALPAPVEGHFEAAVGTAKQLESARKAADTKKPSKRHGTSKQSSTTKTRRKKNER